MELLPNNKQAEIDMLYMIITRNDAIDEIDLKDSHFFSPVNKLIFQAAKHLREKKEEINELTIFNYIKNRGKDNLVSEEHILEIGMKCIQYASTAKSLYKVLEDERIKREGYLWFQETSKQILSSDDPQEIVLSSLGKLEAFAKGRTESISTVSAMLESYIEVLDRRTSGKDKPVTYRTGLVDLDKKLNGFTYGQFDLLGARPSMGKTSFMINCAINASEAGTKMMIISLEMSKEEILEQMISIKSSVETSKLEGADEENPIDGDEWDKLYFGFEKLMNADMVITDKARTPNQIISAIREGVKQHGVQAVYIDFIQKVDFDTRGDTSSELSRALTKFAYKLKDTAADYNIHILALAQLNRECERRVDRRPIMSDLGESQGLERAAYKIMFLYRDEVMNEDTDQKGIAEIIIRKNRRGGIGTVRTAFIPQFTRFENLTTNHNYYENKPSRIRMAT